MHALRARVLSCVCRVLDSLVLSTYARAPTCHAAPSFI